ncbi:MAG: MBL fold metallo-hydrolase [Propionibacteriales bacterium]|nr:MBL fold metallo-hydrolase [Propionibacteriales bacterium]
MTYHGKVRPGTPAVRELKDVMITKASVGPMDNNAYLLRCRRTDESLLIDAAADAEVLLGLLAGQPLSTVVTTHQHGDHWGALAAVVEATGAQTIAGTDDAAGIPVATDLTVDAADVIRVGEVDLEVIHLVGHTPGSIALLYDDPTGPPHLWTGDSLFPGGVGKTWSAADFSTLVDQVSSKVFDRLPDETWVYPGHGDDTTLGAERPHLAEWRERGW